MTTVMRLQVFGKITDIVPPEDQLELVLPMTGGELRTALHRAYPLLAHIPLRLAVDGVMVADETVVSTGTELVVFPPASGG